MTTPTSKYLLGSAAETERRDALRGVYVSADRMWLNQRVDVKFVSGRQAPGGAPAWNDGQTVFFNLDLIPDISPETITSLHGLNFHELGHLKYTPRSNSRLRDKVEAARVFRAFNMLEDQRIETFLCTRYRSAEPWLSACIGRFIVGDPRMLPVLLPLLWGRRYLPDALREGVRDQFVKPEIADEIMAIIDEYRLLTFPIEQDRGFTLIERFHALLAETDAANGGNGDPNNLPDPFGHDVHETPMTNGRPSGVDEQRDAKKREQRREEEREQERRERQQQSADDDATDDDGDGEFDDDEFDDEPDVPRRGSSKDDEQDDDESDGDDEPGDSDDDADSDGDESADGDDDTSADGDGDDDSDTDGDGDADGDGQPEVSIDITWESTGEQSSDGAGTEAPGTPEITDLAQQLVDAITNDAGLREEIQKIQKQALSAGAGDMLPDQEGVHFADPEDYARRGLRKFSKELLAIKHAIEMGWERRTDEGRVNAVRWRIENRRDEAFDLWDEGKEDALDLEVVLLLDNSPSMNNMSRVCQEGWAIKRALDDIGATVSVITYNTAARWLYRPHEKAHKTAVKVCGTTGGTTPNPAIEQALKIMAASRRSLRVLIILTDGSWQDRVSAGEEMHCHTMIDRLNRADVITALGYLADGEPDATSDAVRHRCAIFHHLREPGDLTPFARSIVRQAIGRRLARR